MKTLSRYFPELSPTQISQFDKLPGLYEYWNAQINVISRKDIAELELRHVLHSLGIAKVQEFNPGSRILDIGTGGGFPGIPLAILFPETQFHLVDSIGKKIKVVREVARALGLNNMKADHVRAEKVKGKYDFIISRAVTRMDVFVQWTRGKVADKSNHKLKNGILYLKGGDLAEELKRFHTVSVFDLNAYFVEPFFDTKKVVHLPVTRNPVRKKY